MLSQRQGAMGQAPRTGNVAVETRHDVEGGRFWASVEGLEAEVHYRREEGRVVIDHTLVPQALEGRGIAGQLVRATLDFARDAGLKVVPACSYAAAYIQRHPEYASMVD